eukprot:gb/GEZJ01004798.1/.p1 GENE.gb/GEZJ01004798.1/~~gb/GEZJ01004798.1/.p1  ORF type:complete len:188 (+),score=10.00 gb/GEZJ01004798.1/:1796-2359(+)
MEGLGYALNLFLTMRILMLSVIMAIKSSTRFCVSAPNRRFKNDTRELSEIISWFVSIERGGAVRPCDGTRFAWSENLSNDEGLFRLIRRLSFQALCKEALALSSHMRRAETLAADLVRSLEPCSLSLDDVISSAYLNPGTCCANTERCCSVCLARKLQRRVNKTRHALSQLDETLSVCMEEAREILV